MHTASTAITRRSRFSPVLLAFAGFSLAGCLVSDPSTGPDAKQDVAIPEDNGRFAGSSSSTNWPPDFGDPRPIGLIGLSGDGVRIRFVRLQDVPPFGFAPATCAGTLRIYRAGIIPSLVPQTPVTQAFTESDSLSLSVTRLDSLANAAGVDTLRFNLNIQSDTVQIWLMGYTYVKPARKVTSSPLSNSSAPSVFLKTPTQFFKGNVLVDMASVPPVSGISEFSFYIPGTPVHGRLKAGTVDSIGPLPEGEYPVRLLRISRLSPQATVTLVEAWEVHIAKNDKASFTPGAKVFSTEIQGVLTLRD